MYLVQHLHNSTRLYTCSTYNYRYEVAGRQGIVPAGGPFIVVLPGWRALSYFRRWSIRLPYLLVGFFIPCSTSQLTLPCRLCHVVFTSYWLAEILYSRRWSGRLPYLLGGLSTLCSTSQPTCSTSQPTFRCRFCHSCVAAGVLISTHATIRRGILFFWRKCFLNDGAPLPIDTIVGNQRYIYIFLREFSSCA